MNPPKPITWLVALTVFSWGFPMAGASAQQADAARVVKKVRAEAPGGLYAANREPLQPGGLMELPIGSIKPKGWLRYQLEAEANGMTGRLPEVSPWCKFEGNAWTDP